MSDLPEPVTLVELMARSVRAHPDRPALGQKCSGAWRWLTYSELANRVDSARGGLASLGVGPGDRVAVICDNCVEWVALVYAVWQLGAVVVPMYEAQKPDEWAYIIRDAAPKVLAVANTRVRDLLEQRRATLTSVKSIVVCVGDADMSDSLAAVCAGVESTTDVVEPASDALAELIYTSGTTGTPKGVMLSHANLASNAYAAYERSKITADDRTLAFLPWAHCFGQTSELHTMLLAGACVAIAESRDSIVRDIVEVRPTILVGVPHFFNRLYHGIQKKVAQGGPLTRALFAAALRAATRTTNQPHVVARYDAIRFRLLDRLVLKRIRARLGGRVRFAVSGGAALSPEVLEFMNAIGVPVFEGYGLTETSPLVSTNAPDDHRLGSVGRPVNGVRVSIASSTQDGERDGEIIVYGGGVMMGYFNQPELSAAAFTADGGLRTGDMGRLDDDGYLYITGRIKVQYKLENGKYVAPEPLEEDLKMSPLIANAMLYGANKHHNVALIVADEQAVREWAQQEGVDEKDYELLLEHARLRSRIGQEISTRCETWKSFERVEDFLLIREDFSVDNGQLTQTLKLKRPAIMSRYERSLENLFRSP